MLELLDEGFLFVGRDDRLYLATFAVNGADWLVSQVRLEFWDSVYPVED